ncbi:hypothetical protein LTR36_002447 [Oleoguttula mirabilis]|uniref:Uncharacterized protein n=1 Tax=Oleoguttula mirabilis TaxID=1507867 RepID=A0AAV9JLN5_9PEZI|nr:hypothetical protein LTR36_002447 [Oleoguttula mirabilis]
MALAAPASLLGLPKELRLHVYEHVLSLDIRYEVRKRHDKNLWGHYSYPLPNYDATLRLPWLHLLRTCKTIHDEIHDFMHRPSSPKASADRYTYEAELEPSQRWWAVLERLTWHKMPCPPARARRVVATINARHTHGPILDADGVNVSSIVNALYHALHHLLHCGPLLNPSKPLHKPMRIEELIVIYDYGETCTREETVAWEEQHLALWSKAGRHQPSFLGPSGEISGVLLTGMLSGYVGKVVVRCASGQHESMVETGLGVSDCITRGGFKWDGLRLRDFTDYFEELPVHLLNLEG